MIPYLALRSYLPADDPAKEFEMGSEPTPGEFIDALLDVTEELARVLAPHGSICVELGDTFSGSGGAGGDYNEGGLRDGQTKFKVSARRDRAPMPAGVTGGHGWPMSKSLTMIPESYRWALAYGRNPFNGRETPPWRVRNVVRHFRPNPPVGALGDKVRPATSDWVVACKSGTRFFDLDAVRGNPEDVKDQRIRTTNGPKNHADASEVLTANYTERVPSNPAGAPPLDWWDDDDLEWKDASGFIQPTSGFKGSHYAVFSPRVVKRLIVPMCPERVCRRCGEPSRRIVGEPTYVDSHSVERGDPQAIDKRVWKDERNSQGAVGANSGAHRVAETIGWTECDCSDDQNPRLGLPGKWRRGIVLDPFAGSGTTISVAMGNGFDAIGIDLDQRNAALARERVGMFLEVVGDEEVVA